MTRKHAFINASSLVLPRNPAKPGESQRSLKIRRNTTLAGKGFDASRVGDSHVDAPYRPR